MMTVESGHLADCKWIESTDWIELDDFTSRRIRFSQDGHQAACDWCNWHGPLRSSRADAREDIEAHHCEDHSPGWQGQVPCTCPFEYGSKRPKEAACGCP